MEPPCCPVCLESYDGDGTVPRVLSCGHSACQLCLYQLPQPYQRTIRCPACTQLVPLCHPASLPKNIDLLRLIDPNLKTQISCSQRPRSSSAELVRCPWSHEFYSTWKVHILPQDSVVTSHSPDGHTFFSLFHGRLTCYSPASEASKSVTLLFIAKSSLLDSEFSPSYVSLLAEALYLMNEKEREELSLLIHISRQARFCNIYGVWMDTGDGSIFLVSERLTQEFPCSLNGLLGANSFHGFVMAGMEMCEAVIGLHSEGTAVGFMPPSCFRSDCYGHFFIDFNEVILSGRMVTKAIDADKILVGTICTYGFLSPEAFMLLYTDDCTSDCDSFVSFASDVWSMACIFMRVLTGNELTEEALIELYSDLSFGGKYGKITPGQYNIWKEKMTSQLPSVQGTDLEQLHQILVQCLDHNPGSRPSMINVWELLRGLLISPHDGFNPVTNVSAMPEKHRCSLILRDLCFLLAESGHRTQMGNEEMIHRSFSNLDLADSMQKGCMSLIEGLFEGKIRCDKMKGHRDCITGLAIGGGYLFSSSFDKTINIWSLMDFSHLKSLRGHEHRVMAVVVIDLENPVCISGDSGAVICVWNINSSQDCGLLKKWKEHCSWRYSGVHCLAISGTEFLYSGSGDKSIKVWSLEDYNLVSTMTGHESVVSCLAVSDGVLYSGSWDGTVRLWLLHDYSPLAVLEENSHRSISAVLSLVAGYDMLYVSHESGCVKIWKNDVLVKALKAQNGAILSLARVGKYLFMGGWNESVSVQELIYNDLETETRLLGSFSCKSTVTSLIYWEGKLLVGLTDMAIMAFYCKP